MKRFITASGVGAVFTALILPLAASAASIWDVASTTDTLNTAFTNTGTILVVVIGTVVVGLIALLGLGFGIRHLRKYITGRKF